MGYSEWRESLEPDHCCLCEWRQTAVWCEHEEPEEGGRCRSCAIEERLEAQHGMR